MTPANETQNLGTIYSGCNLSIQPPWIRFFQKGILMSEINRTGLKTGWVRFPCWSHPLLHVCGVSRCIWIVCFFPTTGLLCQYTSCSLFFCFYSVRTELMLDRHRDFKMRIKRHPRVDKIIGTPANIKQPQVTALKSPSAHPSSSVGAVE